MRADQNHGLLWLVALALFGSLISLYYYLIVLKVIFSEPALSEVERVDESPLETASPMPVRLAPRTSTSQSLNLSTSPDFFQRASLSALAALIIFLGVIPGTLVDRIIAAVP
jgi:NADH:ubiquinone oxidoreductase subunit 2 (subunit N)